MSLFDELKKLTQPFGDDDDFYEGADGAFIQKEKPAVPANDAQTQFENTFASEQAAPEPASGKNIRSGVAGSIFGNLGGGLSQNSPRQAKPSRAQKKSSAGADQSVIRFNPKDFDEAGELVNFLEQGRSLIMSLEDLSAENARRLLDFMSGIAFAVNGKITPVSAKTYFVTPENVDLLDAQTEKEAEPDYDEF